MENRLAQLETTKTKALTEIDHARSEIDHATASTGKPFPQAADLTAAGERSRERTACWNECRENGYICIGWDELGDVWRPERAVYKHTVSVQWTDTTERIPSRVRRISALSVRIACRSSRSRRDSRSS